MNMSDLKRFIEKRKQVIIKDLKNNSNLNTKQNERLTECGRIDPARGYRWDFDRNINN